MKSHSWTEIFKIVAQITFPYLNRECTRINANKKNERSFALIRSLAKRAVHINGALSFHAKQFSAEAMICGAVV